jgi:Cytochrome c7 and related cytochrome c
MAKEEDKPLEYQRRLRDTKGVAQRLDLSYLKRPAILKVLRDRLIWVLLAVAILASVPVVMGVGGSRRVVANGPLSKAHSLFEKRCEVCHTESFGGVTDKACSQCHDGAAHPAKLVDTGHSTTQVRCVECHVEHRGRVRLAELNSANCTACHRDIAAHSTGAKVKNVTGFGPGRHPEFRASTLPDARPIKLNHAAHMPAEPKTIRGMKLPMKCGDCHVADKASPTNIPMPVTFEQNCKSCHSRELEFDVYQVLGKSMPAPHTKDAKAIREHIVAAYTKKLAEDPGVARRPLGNDLNAPPSAAAWLDRVVRESEQYLFGRKCGYCHQTSGDGLVQKVNLIQGRYVESKPEGAPWLERGEFSHRKHRAVECESCHTQARTSTKTEDVLIPSMKSCVQCHGESGTTLDECAMCHLYHNRSLEKERDRNLRELIDRGAGR